MSINLKDFSYTLPDSYIAQSPAHPRDLSKLLMMDRNSGSIKHQKFRDIVNYLGPNDVLVLNNSKVFPARLNGKKSTGKEIEVLLLRKETENSWWAMSFPGLKVGNQLDFVETQNFVSLQANVINRDSFSGQVLIEFDRGADQLTHTIYQIGKTPIPPYIKSIETKDKSQELRLRQEYQTVFAKEIGSAAAPTAGLHFTQKLLDQLKAKGVQIEYVTLHVGPGTFQRLWQENIDQGTLHTEWYEIQPEVAGRLVDAKQKGKRIISVGTTSTRTLESAFLVTSETNKGSKDSKFILKTGWQTTELFIQPGYGYNFVDGLITNFHLPESSLLMLVSAFASFPQTEHTFISFSDSLIGKAYQSAIENNYRFYSFGDAMFIH